MIKPHIDMLYIVLDEKFTNWCIVIVIFGSPGLYSFSTPHLV